MGAEVPVDEAPLAVLQPEVTAEMAEALASMDVKARAAAPGEEVGAVELPVGDIAGGMTIRRSRPSSLVRIGGRPAPERWPVYDRSGMRRDVPTAALMYHLGKTNRNGERVFFLHPPVLPKAETRTRLEGECRFCIRAQGRSRPWYDELDLEMHMQSFHEREYQALIRRREMEARRATVDPKALAAAVLMMSAAEKRIFKQLLGAEPGKGSGRKVR